MDTQLKSTLWDQFGAAIDMLENAISECPEELWSDRSQEPEFWYLVYHTLFWLDFYLYGKMEGFAPPEPFGLEELDPAGVLPERPYTKDELRTYLQHGRKRCKATIHAMTNEDANKRYKFGWGEVNGTGLLIYNMRHVQHGAAQLNLILRQKTDSAPSWVGNNKNG